MFQLVRMEKKCSNCHQLLYISLVKMKKLFKKFPFLCVAQRVCVGGVHIQIERESAWGKHTERVCACVGYTCRVCHIQIERERVCHIQIERERVCHIQIKREREYVTYRKSMCVRWIHIQSMSHTDRERECVCGWDTHTDKESVCVGYTYR